MNGDDEDDSLLTASGSNNVVSRISNENDDGEVIHLNRKTGRRRRLRTLYDSEEESGGEDEIHDDDDVTRPTAADERPSSSTVRGNNSGVGQQQPRRSTRINGRHVAVDASSSSEEEILSDVTIPIDISDEADFDLESDEERPKRQRSNAGDVAGTSSANNSAEGRRRRRILGFDELAPATRQAMVEERERQARLFQQQKSVTAGATVTTEVDSGVKIVLEYADGDAKTPALQVHPEIANKLKPHQIDAVQFMWQTTCESLQQLKNPKAPGGGCLIAHCMGLGKTLTSISFVHTLLANRQTTGVKTCLILSPLNAKLNWLDEFNRWQPLDRRVEVYDITPIKQLAARACHIREWQRRGGVLVLGYQMYRSLVAGQATPKKMRGGNKRGRPAASASSSSTFRPDTIEPVQDGGVVVIKKTIQNAAFIECLLNPGPDLIIFDEGHILKSSTSAISQTLNQVRTRRRIVLTGTPLQNNLMEYHCMVNFVKPGLLGNAKEFANRFANPIKNGEVKDASEDDVRLMKRRVCILYRILTAFVHRRGFELLTKALPTKYEYVIMLRFTEAQAKVYRNYLRDIVKLSAHRSITEEQIGILRKRFFADYYALRYVSSHPYLLYVARKKAIEAERKMLSKLPADSSDDDELLPGEEDRDEDLERDEGSDDEPEYARIYISQSAVDERRRRRQPKQSFLLSNDGTWFSKVVGEESCIDDQVSSKIMILIQLIRRFEAVGDKTLVFSQSLLFLDLIEVMLAEEERRRSYDPALSESLPYIGWRRDDDYFRIDGSVGAVDRSNLIRRFNSPGNSRGRLFLISTRAGGIGVNLTAANRCVILDTSWNPCNDSQALFRTYRFGQTKNVYVYRLVAAGSMEEKIYDRQVMKQSLAHRVVDEKQILRHFTSKEIAELYRFKVKDNIVRYADTPPPDWVLEEEGAASDDDDLTQHNSKSDSFERVGGGGASSSTSAAPNLVRAASHTMSRYAVPKDSVFAGLLLECSHIIKSYHDHDSLLAHQQDQELSELERMIAWREYECEKRGYPIEAVKPGKSHQMLAMAYMQQHHLPHEVASHQALCFLRDQLADVCDEVRAYVEENMQQLESRAKDAKDNPSPKKKKKGQTSGVHYFDEDYDFDGDEVNKMLMMAASNKEASALPLYGEYAKKTLPSKEVACSSAYDDNTGYDTASTASVNDRDEDDDEEDENNEEDQTAAAASSSQGWSTMPRLPSSSSRVGDDLPDFDSYSADRHFY